MLRLSRERLSGTTFPKIAQQVYLRFLRKLAPELDALSDQALIDRYDQVDIANHLFAFDESFAHQDNVRAKAMMKALAKLSKSGTQSFIFTCRNREGALATELCKNAGVFRISHDDEPTL